MARQRYARVSISGRHVAGQDGRSRPPSGTADLSAQSMTEYKIFRAETWLQLQYDVNAAIAKGWLPLGAPFLSRTGQPIAPAQAMTREAAAAKAG